MNRSAQIIRTSIVGIVTNVLLASFKALVGILSSSIAIVMDAVNNLSDALSSVITIVGTKLSQRPADRKHPFGYGRVEYFSAILIAVIVLSAGITSLIESVKKIIEPTEPSYTTTTLIVIIVAIVVKLLLGWYVKRQGTRLKSDALIASGSDALFDAVITLATLVSAGVMLIWGFSLDGILGTLISAVIIKAGVEMLASPVGELLGSRVSPELVTEIKKEVMAYEEVHGVYDIILHNYGPEVMIGSLHVSVDDTLTAQDIHGLSRKITLQMYRDHAIVMTVGVYAVATGENQRAEIQGCAQPGTNAGTVRPAPGQDRPRHGGPQLQRIAPLNPCATLFSSGKKGYLCMINSKAMIKSISSEIKYIGVDDVDLDLFESQYVVPEGMAYNSYVILDDKVAVMDTVDARKGAAWLENLEEALGGRKPDYLVVHHMEPDHSGSILEIARKYPDIQIVATAKALVFLGQFFDGETFNTLAVKEGDTLSLGAHTLQFILAPMVHWPEVMVSFDSKDKVLFAADAFGKFGALSKCGYFGEEDDDWACEARRYYFNICGKYGAPVQVLLKKVLPLAPAVIAPLHGPILRENLGEYIDLYQTWSTYGVETEGVFIACASIHGGTMVAAEKLKEILLAKGCPKVALADLTRDDQAEAVEDAFRYGKMVLCAASYDGGLFSPAYNFIHTLQMKSWQKKKVALVENGTWAPTAGKVMKELFGAMKDVEIVGETVTLRSRMKDSDLPALEALADAIVK